MSCWFFWEQWAWEELYLFLFFSAVFSPKPQNHSHHQKPDLSVSAIFGGCEPQASRRDHSQQVLELDLQAKTLMSPVPLP